jgi:catechol-2,3-dioxygenase
MLWLPSNLAAQVDRGGSSPPFDIVGQAFFAVQVRDDSAAAQWYAQAFGLAELRHMARADRGYSIRILRRGGLIVELIRVDSAARGLDVRLGLFKAGFYVDDIDAAYAWLRVRGAEMDRRIVTDEALHARTFVMRDPEGNRLQLFAACALACDPD